MKKRIIQIAVKVIVAALTAFLTAITTTSCMGLGPLQNQERLAETSLRALFFVYVTVGTGPSVSFYYYFLYFPIAHADDVQTLADIIESIALEVVDLSFRYFISNSFDACSGKFFYSTNFAPHF